MNKILLFIILIIVSIQTQQNIVHLDDNNFSSVTSADPDQMWMVMFHADWCGHCQNIKPVFYKTAELMETYGIKFALVNEKDNHNLINKYVVDHNTHMVSYPTLLVILQEQVLAKVPGNLGNAFAIQNWFLNYFKIVEQPNTAEEL